MISREELDSLQQYLKCKGVMDIYNSEWYSLNSEWYSLNGLEINIDLDCVYVYLMRDKWLIASTSKYAPRSNDNPHNVISLDYTRLIRLIDGGEMAYNNMENEWILNEL